VRGGERGFSLPSAMFLKSVKMGVVLGGWWGKRGSSAKTTVEQNVDRKSENI
jgi:hypothetical protein